MVVVRSALLLWIRGDSAPAAVCKEGPSPGEADHDRNVENINGQGVEREIEHTKCQLDCSGR